MKKTIIAVMLFATTALAGNQFKTREEYCTNKFRQVVKPCLRECKRDPANKDPIYMQSCQNACAVQLGPDIQSCLQGED